MNDRYLFRGKRLDTGEWIEGFYCDSQMSGCYILQVKSTLRTKGEGRVVGDTLYTYEINPATLGQCTGIKDKNGKLIFEGDIVKTNTGVRFIVIWVGRLAGFYYETAAISCRIQNPMNSYEVEIIGNIHDNPELLTKEGADRE